MNQLRRILKSTASSGAADSLEEDEADSTASASSSASASAAAGAAMMRPPKSAPPTLKSPPFDQLGLMHLKKMYAEFTSPSHPLLDAEKEERLYNILPLFTKVKKKYALCGKYDNIQLYFKWRRRLI